MIIRQQVVISKGFHILLEVPIQRGSRFTDTNTYRHILHSKSYSLLVSTITISQILKFHSLLRSSRILLVTVFGGDDYYHLNKCSVALDPCANVTFLSKL